MMNDEARQGTHHEHHLPYGQRLSSPAPGTMRPSHRSSPGILVFSHKRHLPHVNRAALDLLGHLEQTETGPATTTLTRLVSELRVQIQDALDSRRDANVRDLVEWKRVRVESWRKILLRGFGLPDRNSSNLSRVIIVLEEVSLQQAQAKVQSPHGEGAAQEHTPVNRYK